MHNLIILWIFSIVFSCLIGPIGCCLFWNRLSYLGDALLHGTIFGTVVACRFGFPITPTLFITSLLFGSALQGLNQLNHRNIPKQVLVGMITQTAFAIALLQMHNHDCHGHHGGLLGDWLHLGWSDLAWFALGSAVLLAVCKMFWYPFLSITVQPELAYLEGLAVEKYRLALYVLLCAATALCLPYLGGLLTVTLFIAPVACAHLLARSTKEMVYLSTACSMGAMSFALLPVYYWACPFSIAAAVTSCSLFVILLCCSRSA